MKVLFDNGTPRPLRSYLRPHTVTTSAQLGWEELKNGELLRAAVVAEFAAIVTTDQNWQEQQDLRKFPSLVIIVLGETDWRIIRPQAAKVKAALDTAQPGAYITLDFS